MVGNDHVIPILSKMQRHTFTQAAAAAGYQCYFHTRGPLRLAIGHNSEAKPLQKPVILLPPISNESL